MSKASKGAALSSIGRDIPNIFSSVLDAYRSGKDRKDAKEDRELDRKLKDLQMQGAQKGLEAQDIAIQGARGSLDMQTQAANAIAEAKSALLDENKRKALFDTLTQVEEKMKSGEVPLPSPSGLAPKPDKLLETLGKEPGGIKGQFAGMEPSGKTPDEITKEKILPYRKVSPIAGAMMDDIDVREEAARAAEAARLKAESDKEAKTEQRLFDIAEQKNKFAQEEKILSKQQAHQLKMQSIDLAARRALEESKQNAASTKTPTPNSNQFQAATYALKVEEAQNTIDKLIADGFNPASFKAKAIEKGDLSAIKDPVERQYAQAARTFINSTLRRESGAAIAEGEFVSARKQYFPELGDDEKTQELKRKHRQINQAGFKSEAGDAYNQVKKAYGSLQEPTETAAVPVKMEDDPEFMDLLRKARK